MQNYYAGEHPAGEDPKVSRYAWGRDYHNVLGRRLRKLARFVEETWPGEKAIPAVDSKPVLEKVAKDAADKAKEQLEAAGATVSVK